MANQLLDSYVKGGSSPTPSISPNSLLTHYVSTNPAAIAQPKDPVEQHLVSSFQAIDPQNRQKVLTSLVKQAQGGDKMAMRKVQLLTPHLQAAASVTPDYTPKDIGSKVGAALYDIGSGVVNSAKTTGETIASSPHIVNAAGLSLASMAEHQHGAQLAKTKQVVLNEIQKTPYGKNFGKTVAENNAQPITKQLAGVGGTTLENVLNVATLGEGTVAKQVAEQVVKSVVGKEGANLARQIATKQAVKGSAGFIRDLGNGQFARTAIHPDDAQIMDQFIDHARGALKLNPEESKKLGGLADMLAEHYGIGTAATTDKQLASAFQKTLSSSPEALNASTKLGEAGKLSLPEGIKPTGKLVTGSAGQRLLEGAKIGTGYGVAQAGEQNITDPTQLAKTIGTSALTGGVMATGVPAVSKVIGNIAKGVERWARDPIEHVAEERVRSSGQQFPNQKSYNKAVDVETANIKKDATQLRAIDEAYTQGGFKGLTAETGKPGTAGVPIDVPVAGMKPTKGTPLVQTQEQAVKGRAIASNTKQNLSSRVKQYESTLQDSIKGIEGSGGYQQLLAEHGGDKVISNASVLSAAKQLGPMDEHLIMNAKPLDKIDTVTLVRAKATVDTAAKEFLDAWQSGKYTDSQLTRMSKHTSALTAGYKIMSAEPGRATQIQSTFIADAFNRAEKLKSIMDETKGATPEIRNQRIAQDLAAFDKNMAQAKGIVPDSTIERLKATVKKYVGPTSKIVSEYATSAKLTSPMTHVKNIASNFTTLLQRGAEKTVTTGWGALKGETSLGEVKNIFGTSQALKNATMQFGRDLKQSLNPKAADLPNDHSKSEIQPAISGATLGLNGKAGRAVDITGKVIRTPFNFLGAADNFFKTMLRDSELHSSAFSKGYQEGFRGGALNSRVAELVKSPTADMAAKAEKTALEFTFQDDPGIIANKFTEILAKLPLLRLLVPFVKTPTNIVKFQYQRSVLGVFSKRNIQDLVSGGVERREAVARLGVGAGMSLGAAMAVFNAGDNITGAAPTNAGDKDNFYAEGKKPYSIKIGGKWVQYNALEPLGIYVTQAVGLRDALTDGNSKTAGNIFSSMAVTTAKGIADLPFVSGVNNVIVALNDPSNQSLANKAFGQLITGLIPNISRDVANAQDSTPRVTKSITDQVKAVIPGEKQTLPARTTVFGADQADTRSGLERGLIKITGNDQSTKLTKTLDEVGKDTGYYPQPPKTVAKLNGKPITPTQFSTYERQSGNLFASKLEKALNDPVFNKSSSDDKAATIKKMITDSRNKVADTLVGKPTRNSKHKVKAY